MDIAVQFGNYIISIPALPELSIPVVNLASGETSYAH